MVTKHVSKAKLGAGLCYSFQPEIVETESGLTLTIPSFAMSSPQAKSLIDFNGMKVSGVMVPEYVNTFEFKEVSQRILIQVVVDEAITAFQFPRDASAEVENLDLEGDYILTLNMPSSQQEFPWWCEYMEVLPCK